MPKGKGKNVPGTRVRIPQGGATPQWSGGGEAQTVAPSAGKTPGVKKREATPKRPKVSPAAVDAPPATIPEELETLWDERVATAFAALRPKQQSFLLVYIRKGNAAEAYRKSYNPLADSHLATVCGNGILSNPAIGDILHKLTEQKTADLLLTIKTFRDMAEAVKPNWVQDEAGQWENTGEEPDWKARNDAAKGLAMLRGLNQPTEVKHSGEIATTHKYIIPEKRPIE